MKTGNKLRKMENKTGKKTVADIFSYRLCKLRERNGYTQLQVAEQIGVTVRSYLNWENGGLQSKIDIEFLQKLAKLYHVSVDYLLGNSDHYIYDSDYISAETGLSHDAIYALSLLNGNHGVSDGDPWQKARLDIPALNLILEKFLKDYEKIDTARKFSTLTDTILNLVGQYIDGNNAAFPDLPIIKKDDVCFIYSNAEMARGVFGVNLYNLLFKMATSDDLSIIALKKEYQKHLQEVLENSSAPPSP